MAARLEPAEAERRFIVRNDNDTQAMQTAYVLAGCNVARSLDGSLGQLFLVTIPDSVDPDLFLGTLLLQAGVSTAEFDLPVSVLQTSSTGVPSG